MTTMTQQPVGSPIWFELATNDQADAKRYYAELLGWTVTDHAIDAGGSYSIFQHQGRDVAACYTMMPEQVAQGLRPNWGVYFRVEDCDATVARVRAGGGSVLMEPFEVMNHLRMAVVADPDGAVFSLYQARQHPGVGVIHEVDTIGWVELATTDLGRAEHFYRDLFRWGLTEHSNSPIVYRIFNVDGVNQGGLLQMTAEWDGVPPHWSIYLRVADVDATVAKAQALGGSVCVPAFDAPGTGRIAMITDPAGASAYLIALSR